MNVPLHVHTKPRVGFISQNPRWWHGFDSQASITIKQGAMSTYMHTWVYTRICMFVFVYVCMYICMYIYVLYMYIYMCVYRLPIYNITHTDVCIYIYIYISVFQLGFEKDRVQLAGGGHFYA